jgi:hypothetical protein
MLNPFKEVNWNPDVAARRKFAKSLIIGFPCVALFFFFVTWLKTGLWQIGFPLRLGGIGAGMGVVLWFVPAMARPFYVVWYTLACCIGLVVGNVLLGVIFYGLVTGIGLAKRLRGRQSIRKTADPATTSYWIDAPPAADPRRYFNQY